MKSYKVIKDFACAKKGDILTYNEDSDLFEFDIQSEDGNYCRAMFIDGDTAGEYAEDGFLLEFEDETCNCCQDCEAIAKLNEIEAMIDNMLAQYEADNKATQEKYESGEIPTCVKVEAETVYFNLNKALNKIKSKINE